MPLPKRKALFLDRDGTLIESIPYLGDANQVRLLPGVTECLSVLKQEGWLFFLFSNQSGVGRGWITLQQVEACNRRLLELIGLGDDLFTRVCVSTGTPDSPDPYRKPSPKFILECLEAYALPPENCWMVGNKESDIQAGLRAGIGSIWIQPASEASSAQTSPNIQTNVHSCKLRYCRDFFEVLRFLRA